MSARLILEALDESVSGDEDVSMRDGRYRTVVVDPPWPYEGRMSGSRIGGPSQWFMRTAPMPYKTMSIAAIESLKIPAANDSHLYLWTTQRFLRDALSFLPTWGFRLGAVLVWSKPPKGVVGTFVCSTEFCLFGRRGNLPAQDRVIGTCFEWPRGEHSRKPEAFLDMVERVSPGPYLEMFARRNRLGWDTWGNESLDHVEIAS